MPPIFRKIRPTALRFNTRELVYLEAKASEYRITVAGLLATFGMMELHARMSREGKSWTEKPKE